LLRLDLIIKTSSVSSEPPATVPIFNAPSSDEVAEHMMVRSPAAHSSSSGKSNPVPMASNSHGSPANSIVAALQTSLAARSASASSPGYGASGPSSRTTLAYTSSSCSSSHDTMSGGWNDGFPGKRLKQSPGSSSEEKKIVLGVEVGAGVAVGSGAGSAVGSAGVVGSAVGSAGVVGSAVGSVST
jgi:hypothetical protein